MIVLKKLLNKVEFKVKSTDLEEFKKVFDDQAKYKVEEFETLEKMRAYLKDRRLAIKEQKEALHNP